ncbi:Integrase [Hyphomicrobium facile]|uniref:Integrase n=2 Tax=Hyphomicrobium facile TaxID=51670 RepID=A0A1I7N181_9HYPH|nr:Integrase [Hyphomicrobium facile]
MGAVLFYAIPNELWDEVWGNGFDSHMSSELKKSPSDRRRTNGLSAVFVRQKKAPGRYGDGNGLYLVVDRSGASRWVLRVMYEGRRRDVGLGGASTVTLAEARDKAHEIRKLAKLGQDPVAARRTIRDGVPKFENCARTVHKARKAAWRNGKHQAQWLKTLELYAFPTIGQMAINRIGTAEVLKLLLPIWSAKPETARRVLQRVSTIIDYGTAAGMRSGENPCRLAILGLPKHTDETEHFAALPYVEVPAFIAKLRNSNAAEITKLAFEFLVLNASRSGEVRLAPKSEIDFAKALWTIPGARMKGGREHIVPLTPRALDIARAARALYPDRPLLFPSPTNPEKPLSTWRLRSFCAASRSMRPHTAFALVFAIGAARKRAFRARLPKWRSLTPSSRKSKLLIGVECFWESVVG